MSLRTANRALLILFVSVAASARPALALEKVISGQVRDDKNNILPGIKVDLWTNDGAVSLTTRTNEGGKFTFKHPSCGPCFLEVMAPRKSNLASALVDDIPGDEGRTVVVTLKRGYPVFGRVTSQGKGLKGIVVKAYSRRHDTDRKERVYGGGAVLTRGGGDFEMTLTPGEKKFVLLNNKYDRIAKHANINAKVIVETDLGDIEMPAR